MRGSGRAGLVFGEVRERCAESLGAVRPKSEARRGKRRCFTALHNASADASVWRCRHAAAFHLCSPAHTAMCRMCRATHSSPSSAACWRCLHESCRAFAAHTCATHACQPRPMRRRCQCRSPRACARPCASRPPGRVSTSARTDRASHARRAARARREGTRWNRNKPWRGRRCPSPPPSPLRPPPLRQRASPGHHPEHQSPACAAPPAAPRPTCWSCAVRVRSTACTRRAARRARRAAPSVAGWPWLVPRRVALSLAALAAPSSCEGHLAPAAAERARASVVRGKQARRPSTPHSRPRSRVPEGQRLPAARAGRVRDARSPRRARLPAFSGSWHPGTPPCSSCECALTYFVL